MATPKAAALTQDIGVVSPSTQTSTRAWITLGMLCFVYVLNFLDRQLLSILAKPIQDSLHITDGQLGLIGGLYFALLLLLHRDSGRLAGRPHQPGQGAVARLRALERGDDGLRPRGELSAARRSRA